MRAPQDDPLLADFVAELDRINGLADASPGFVWRHVSDSRDPTKREFEDTLVLFNMSVWESVDALHAFTYRTDHAAVFAKRRKWFEEALVRTGLPGLVLWWVAAGHRPTVDEAKARLKHLAEHGPTPLGFTFKERFQP
jgi:heme-degrading monooxygenase HmoA